MYKFLSSINLKECAKDFMDICWIFISNIYIFLWK